MNLKSALDDALQNAQRREGHTRFGFDYRAKAEAAAQAARLALQEIDALAEQKIELEGLLKGVELLNEQTQRMVHETVSQFQREVANHLTTLEHERSRLDADRAEISRLVQELHEERSKMQTDLVNKNAEMRAELQEGHEQVMASINDFRSQIGEFFGYSRTAE